MKNAREMWFDEDGKKYRSRMKKYVFKRRQNKQELNIYKGKKEVT